MVQVLERRFLHHYSQLRLLIFFLLLLLILKLVKSANRRLDVFLSANFPNVCYDLSVWARQRRLFLVPVTVLILFACSIALENQTLIRL